MKCPLCNFDVEKLSRFGLCPNPECKAQLKIVEVDGERKLVFRKKVEDFKEDEIETFESIFNDNEVRLQKSNYGNFILEFYKFVNYGWIYCPGCQSKMFQNNILSGSMEHKCHKCKAITTYVFK